VLADQLDVDGGDPQRCARALLARLGDVDDRVAVDLLVLDRPLEDRPEHRERRQDRRVADALPAQRRRPRLDRPGAQVREPVVTPARDDPQVELRRVGVHRRRLEVDLRVLRPPNVPGELAHGDLAARDRVEHVQLPRGLEVLHAPVERLGGLLRERAARPVAAVLAPADAVAVTPLLDAHFEDPSSLAGGTMIHQQAPPVEPAAPAPRAPPPPGRRRPTARGRPRG
jgi:hypothetical protein